MTSQDYLLSGALSNRYDSLQVLGEGGTSHVLLCRDKLHNREVALKLLRAERKPEEGRLLEEFSLLASIDHPGIVKVLDFGVSGDTLYLSSERIDGPRLDEFLALHADRETVQACLCALLSSLGWLHGQGIVHGDLKPANVLVVKNGANPLPVLIDFGLAHSEEIRSSVRGGTPSYMAPELLSSSASHSRLTDLYSLGRCFLPYVEHLEEPYQRLIEKLVHSEPESRPQNASDGLHRVQPQRARLPPFAGRGLTSFWKQAIAHVSAAVKDGSHPHWFVSLPSVEDSTPFLRLLKTALEIEDQAVTLLPSSLESLNIWDRLLEVFCPGCSPQLLMVEAPPPPELQQEFLEEQALLVLQTLQGASDLPVLLVSQPENWEPRERYILSRVLEAELFPALVFGSDESSRFVQGAEQRGSLRRYQVPLPEEENVFAFFEAYNVEVPPPPLVMETILSRREAGAFFLKTQMEVWIQTGQLVPSEGGHWKWLQGGTPALIDSPDLDGLWRQLWNRLPALQRQTFLAIVDLGYEGSLSELNELVDFEGDMYPLLVELIAQGWLSNEAGSRYRIPTSLSNRLKERGIEATSSSEAHLTKVLETLSARADSVYRNRSIAQHLESLGRFNEACLYWTSVTEALETQLNSREAAIAGMEVLRLELDVLKTPPDRMLDWIERTGHLLRKSGMPELVDELFGYLQRVINAPTSSLFEFRASHLMSTFSKEAGLFEKTLLNVNRCETILQKSAVSLPDEEEKQAMQSLSFLKGCTLSDMGAHGDAEAALNRSLSLAQEIGDLRAVGNTVNSLGVLHLHKNEIEKARDAFLHSLKIKEQIQDRRGQAVCFYNLSRVYMELDEVPQALHASRTILRLGEELCSREVKLYSHLSLADIWLHLGSLYEVSEHLHYLSQQPNHSRMVKGNLSYVKLKTLFAQRDYQGAFAAGLSLHQYAASIDYPLLKRNTRVWLYFCCLQLTRLGKTEVSLALPPLSEEEHAPKEDLSYWSCHAHALAVRGSFQEASEQIRELLERIEPTIATHHIPALEPLYRACVLLQEPASNRALLEVTERTFQKLLERRKMLTPEAQLSKEYLAAMFGLHFSSGRSPITSSESPATLPTRLLRRPSKPPQEVDLDRATKAASRGLDELLQKMSTHDLSDMQQWLAALVETTQTRELEIYLYEEEETRLFATTRSLDQEPRWKEMAQQLLHVPSLRGQFLSRSTQTIQGEVLPTLSPGKALGSVFLEWPSGYCGELLAQDTLQLVALLVQDFHRRQQLDVLRGEQRALEQRLEEQRRTHRLELRTLMEALHQSRSDASLRFQYDHMIFNSKAMRAVLHSLERVTELDIPLLILGESGVGKELIARSAHANSPRSAAPFVAENCGAIPSALFESHFFGHMQGAFTGAQFDKTGLFEHARGGTLFLDEIGELRPEQQVKLLRVLQEKRFRPLGSPHEHVADFRVVAATNRDLKAEVERGHFREDLYYRLAVFVLEVPPLRERPEDILPLAQHFLAHGPLDSVPTLTTEASSSLVAYSWPGNIRELENEMLRAAVLSDGAPIERLHLNEQVRTSGSRTARRPSMVRWDGISSLQEITETVEKQIIVDALAAHDWKKAPTARALDISRPGLDGKMGRYGIDLKRLKSLSKQKHGE